MNTAETVTREALALLHAGQPAGATQLLRQALTQNSRWAEGWFNLAHVLRTQGQAEGALKALAAALGSGLRCPEEAHLNRALVLSDLLHDDVAAEAELRRALLLRPGWPTALLNLGNLHEERGESDDAACCYDQILGAAPPPEPEERDRHQDLQVEALARRLHLGAPGAQAVPADAADALRAALQDPARGRAARVDAGHSLGQWLDAQGAFDDAFAVLAEANRLAGEPARPYAREATERAVNMLMQTYDGRESRAAPERDTAGFEPLFICGAFRSGSTLIEQVLGAHPSVFAGGELDWLMRHIMLPPLAPYPEAVSSLDGNRLAEVAAAYRTHLTRLFSGATEARFVTDKRPDNLLLVGLIKSLFPRARIVLTVRDPMDTGLSIYSQHLNPGRVPYATDLAATGHHLAQMRRLAAHWRARWPDDVVEVDYDRLVSEPQPCIERLLAFLGLPWNPRCLEFHHHIGVVRTASFRQVRQPFHPRSSGRWRHYASHLAPLADALREGGYDPV